MKARHHALHPILTALLFGLALAASPVSAQSGEGSDVDRGRLRTVHGDRISIFAEDVVIPRDLRQYGQVVAIGVDVRVEGEVRGDLVVINGSLDLTGEVGGSVVTVLTDVRMNRATIRRDFTTVLGRLERFDSSVGGQVVEINIADWIPHVGPPLRAITLVVFWYRLIKLLAAFVLLLLLAALVPDRIRRIGEQTPVRYVPALLVGLLGYLGLLIVLGLLAVTVIGMPLAIFAFVVLKWLGLAGIFHAVGMRLGRSMGREMSLLGAVLLIFVPFALLVILPSVGGLIGLLLSGVIGLLLWLFLDVPAVGLVILTRCGGPKVDRTVVIAPPPPPPPDPRPPELQPPVPAAPHGAEDETTPEQDDSERENC